MSEPIEQLRDLFAEHPAAIAATAPLKKGVSVGLRIHGDRDAYHFLQTPSGCEIRDGAGNGTDFDLVMGRGAVTAVCATQGKTVGDFGVAFFKTLLNGDPEHGSQVKLNAGMLKLAGNGYIKVLTLGGPKVVAFLTKEGYFGPRGIAKAIKKLRRG
jgi:hypothetical protein